MTDVGFTNGGFASHVMAQESMLQNCVREYEAAYAS